MNDYSPRILPHSIEAEQSVLGGILLDNPSYLTIEGLLNDDDFYRQDHQLIFRAMKDMAADQQAIDVLTVSEWMKGRFLNADCASAKRSFFDVIGGLAYLGDLAKDTPSSANIAGYANIVRTYSLKRQVIKLTDELQMQAFQQGSDEAMLTQLLEKATSGFFNFSRLRSPWELSANDWDSVNSGVKKLRGMDIFFDDSATQSPADLRSRCRRLVRETGKPLSAILIDYVQLMHGSSGKNYPNREAEVSAISGEIRALAKDFNCPVILLSQLNRSLEGRPNKRPIMSDLRESGALEQDASCVLFIYRDEVYDKKSKAKGIAELIVAKHRGGKTGTIRCAFVGKNQRFANQKPVSHATKREH